MSGFSVTAEPQPSVWALAEPKTSPKIAAEPTMVLGTESLGLSGSAELCSSVRPPVIPTTATTMLTYMHQRQST
jgi:hypothetical protein